MGSGTMPFISVRAFLFKTSNGRLTGWVLAPRHSIPPEVSDDWETAIENPISVEAQDSVACKFSFSWLLDLVTKTYIG